MSIKRNLFLVLMVLVLGVVLSACQQEQESKELNLLCVPQEE